jgi:hypothetical protein
MTDDKSPQAAANEMFSQAARFFQDAVEAGIRMQEQSTKSMSEMISRFASPPQWQQQAQTTMQQMAATFEKNMKETIELMTENSKTSLELLDKAFEARQAISKGDGLTRTRELWETAMGSFMRNAEVMVQANSRMLDAWRNMADALQSQNGAEPPATEK